jgi:1-acyl-sn-glycerol-3-phosphate acyltransferase
MLFCKYFVFASCDFFPLHSLPGSCYTWHCFTVYFNSQSVGSNGLDELKYEYGSYQTGPVRVSFMARILTSLAFYVRLMFIVIRGSSRAKSGRYGTPEWCENSFATLRALEAVGVKFDITGTTFFREVEGPCVFIANHMSTLETFILPTIIAPFKDVTFVVKQSLVDYPIFKHIMRARNPITVGRTNPREDLKAVLDGGTERLKAGISIIIFPQTTRTPVFDPEQFNTIGIKLAKRAGVPVVPIALRTNAWGNGTFLKDYGRIDPSKTVHFAFGKPLTIKDRGIEEHQEIIEFISGKLKVWDTEERTPKP